MTAIARLGSVAIDCADPKELADFYTALTGWEATFSTDDFVALSGDRLWLTLMRVDDYLAPSWPAGEVRKQLHLDFAVDDLDRAEAAAVAIGAVKAADQPSPDRWRVLLDPAGHPFCLTTLIPEN
ncbi:VOC family protein [Streptomyces sp. NPDC092296]|uniref:VOC family protein n=1 Tax=Streptomyces sp. NPDC092296 TaxID=3366012 RepID=UPI00382D227B